MKIFNFSIQSPYSQAFEARRRHKKTDKYKADNPYASLPKQVSKADISRQAGIPFALKELRFIPCPMCGKRILTNDEVSLIANRLSKKNGEKLYLVIREKQHLLKPVEFNIAQAIMAASLKNPEKNIQELLILVEPKFRLNLISTYEKLIKKAQNIPQKNKTDVYFEVQNHLRSTEHFLKIEKQDLNHNVARIFVINKILELQKNCTNDNDKYYLDKVLSTLAKLPREHEHEGEFIKRYRNLPPYEVAKQLFFPSSGSVDHVLAESKGGSNTMDNLVLSCNSCNTKKSDDSINNLIDSSASVAFFFQNYINAVIDNINKKVIKGFDNYPQKIKQTLLKESSYSGRPEDACIVLDISRLENKRQF